jgi:DNA-binding response OmpR family regulator
MLPVLLASRDTLLLSTRSRYLRRAGFRTLRVQDLSVMASLARFQSFRTVVLDHTISRQEQRAVIKRLREFSSLFHVICIKTSAVASQALLRECKACQEDDANGGIHLLDDGIVLLGR